MYTHQQLIIKARDKALESVGEQYRLLKVQQRSDQANMNQLLIFISELVNELEEAKEMIDDLTKTSKKKK